MRLIRSVRWHPLHCDVTRMKCSESMHVYGHAYASDLQYFTLSVSLLVPSIHSFICSGITLDLVVDRISFTRQQWGTDNNTVMQHAGTTGYLQGHLSRQTIQPVPRSTLLHIHLTVNKFNLATKITSDWKQCTKWRQRTAHAFVVVKSALRLPSSKHDL